MQIQIKLEALMMNKTSNISHYDIKLNEVKEVLYNSLLNNYGIKEIL